MLTVFFWMAVAILLTEAILQWIWSPAYFRSGIVLYAKQITLESPVTMLPQDETLSDKFKGDGIRPSILFMSLSSNKIAFRESLLESHGPRVPLLMHGGISLNHNERAIVLTGRLNWWIISLALVVIALFIEEVDFVPAILFSLGAVLLYFMQTRRYDKIGKAVYELIQSSVQ